MDTEQRRTGNSSRRGPGTRPGGSGSQTRRRRGSTGEADARNRSSRAGAKGTPSGPDKTSRRKRSSTPAPREEKRRPPQRRRSVGSAAPRRKKGTGTPKPEIIYTPPKPFSRNRFLLRLATVVAVVLAVTFAFSIFFRVRTITVSGADLYTPWEVLEASGISEGDNLLTFGRVRASGKIMAALPYVESVRVGIKLPDTVNIEIVERSVVYAIQDSGGGWWLMTATGTLVEQTGSTDASNYTTIVGVLLDNPQDGQIAVAAEEETTDTTTTSEPEETSESEETTETTTATTPPVTITGADRLEIALEILSAMEENGFAGSIDSVDVSSINSLELWYGTQYQVLLGDASDLSYKLQCLKEVIDQMTEHESGVLDISFTTWPDQVGYTPFD